MGFVSLHNHTAQGSNLRFLDSINRPEDLIDKALRLGFSGIAITDHEALCAAVTVLHKRDEIEKDHPDFKIIFGNEIYLIDESEVHNTDKFYHFILLAKDAEGWLQLKTLSSGAWERSYMHKGQKRVPTTYQDIEKVVGQNPGHLLCSTACIGGELPTRILNHDVEKANSFVRWCIKTFGQENVALEIQPSDNEEQIIVNKTIIGFANYYNLPYIITTDSHYLDKEDFEVHKIYLNSKETKERETEKFYRFTYMMSIEEMTSILMAGGLTKEQVETGINNTFEFSKNVEIYDFRHSTIVPEIKIPEYNLSYSIYPQNGQYEYIKKYYESPYEQDKYLMYQIEKGIVAKNIPINDIYLDRINKELDILWYISDQLGDRLSAYFNLAKDFLDTVWQVSFIGPGRGSACGELINYIIDITQVNPLDYDLVYWRFLNKERAEMPDIDSDLSPEKLEDVIRLLREKYGEDNVLQCATFKTESLKSAILSCGRGLGYNNDDMQALAALVPAHRGQTYTLKECLEGNDEKGYEPVENFKQKFDSYPGLFEAVKKIEGLPSNNSRHASALYIFNNGYLEHNSLIKTPNGTKTTAFSMHDSDEQSALKLDALVTDAQSKLMKCVELLLKYNQIKWQGSLRATYNKYLHPDVIDYESPKMWKDINEGRISNLFQMEGQTGITALKKGHPTNIRELAELNSIMRLQSDSGEQPLDKYKRFREDPTAWDTEMNENGLTQHEKDILHKYLDQSNGISSSQEALMQILMDPEISNFTLGEANTARKILSKKLTKKIPKLKEDYYNKGKAAGAREEFLNYVYKTGIEPQLGYSFSLNHTLPYSVVAIQEANLATKYNPLYWACACLCVNAGSNADDLENYEEEGDEEQDNFFEVSEEEQKRRTVVSNYKKIGRAIADIQQAGVKIAPPDINRASIDFIPDVENNAIIYGLLGVKDINEDLINQIIANRPYTSSIDFYQRVQPTNVQMLSLIKAGAFDSVDKKNRLAIMAQYLRIRAEEGIKLKDSMTAANIAKAVKMKVLPNSLYDLLRLYNFNKWIDEHQYNKENKRYEFDDDDVIRFFNQSLKHKFDITKGDYYEIDGKIMVAKKKMTSVYKELIQPLFDWLNSKEGCQAFYEAEINAYIEEQQMKYCQGDLSTWEFDALTCYMGDHELSKVNISKYGIVDFNTLPEKLEPIGTKINARSGKEYNVYNTVRIAGTVVGTDNGKHILTISTSYGIVDVKFYKEEYIYYNKNISEMVTDSKGKTKKETIEKSWFTRGNKLLISGVRRENMFIPKKNWDKGYTHSVELITKAGYDLELKSARETVSKNG